MGGTQRQRLAGPEYHREGMADGVEDTSWVCTLKQGGSGLVSGKEGWETKKGSGLKSTRALAQELCPIPSFGGSKSLFWTPWYILMDGGIT